MPDSQTRRRLLKLSGAAVLPAVLAGCSDGGPGGGGGNESGGNESGGNESAGNESGGNESADGGGGEVIEPGEIELGGETSGWQGVAPEQIADQDNPTLTLQEGEAYEITWENLDGVGHNLQILDDSDQVVDDYETEIMEEQGETQTLEIDEVTTEMVSYICEPHQGTMNGDIEVQ